MRTLKLKLKRFFEFVFVKINSNFYRNPRKFTIIMFFFLVFAVIFSVGKVIYLYNFKSKRNDNAFIDSTKIISNKFRQESVGDLSKTFFQMIELNEMKNELKNMDSLHFDTLKLIKIHNKLNNLAK